MSDRTGVPNSSRGGSRAILSGLAVGAVLGAPVAAVVSSGAAEASAPAVERVVAPHGCGGGKESVSAEAIREQFRASFTAGAITPPAMNGTPVICETS